MTTPFIGTLSHGMTLITANVKHFHAINDLSIERFDPVK